MVDTIDLGFPIGLDITASWDSCSMTRGSFSGWVLRTATFGLAILDLSSDDDFQRLYLVQLPRQFDLALGEPLEVGPLLR